MTDVPLRVALVGMGRMGKTLEALARERSIEVVARLDAADAVGGLTRALLGEAHVAIEFTQPDAAATNAIACLRAGCPVVIGTTGWEAQRQEVADAVRTYRCAALWSPNFSLGVQLLLVLAHTAGRRLRALSGFDTHIVETHHAAKVDAPSGTALAIARQLEGELERSVPITSIRVGAVPGTHEVLIDAPFEQLQLVHVARDRRVFADGALTAARWLAQPRDPALYTMQDMLSDARPGSPFGEGA